MDIKKKLERKRKRLTARLRSSRGIICSDSPTCIIVLCNVGQATGITKDIILNLISHLNPKITPPQFIAEKGETYSFLRFKTCEDAQLFYDTFSNKIFTSFDVYVIMNYAQNAPYTEIIIESETPKGLHILNNFITEEEQKQFIDIFDWPDKKNLRNLKNRQVKHYGYEFKYGSNDVDLNAPLEDKIPELCNTLWTRLKENGFNLNKPDQLTVNKYKPGQGIPSHVDKHSPFGDTILSLSLGSSVVMDWKHYTGKYVPIEIPARSLLVMQGEARYDWHHGIQPRKTDPVLEHKVITSEGEQKNVTVVTYDTVNREIRISLTFRWTRSGPCDCDYKELCDSAVKAETSDIEDSIASNLEDLHVHQVYEKIAGHFSTTRHKPWPVVEEFMKLVEPGAIVLDLGCGNGKNILNRNDILQLGCERSSGLLGECKQQTAGIAGADCVRVDMLHASLTDACADVIICVAVIHHFSSKARRLQAISTIARLLRNGGRTLITVWAKDQKKSNYLCKNKFQDANQQTRITVSGVNLPIHENRTQFQHNDVLVPWKLRTLNEKKLSSQPQDTLLRFYHVFEVGELEELCTQVNDLIIEDSFYEEGNWCVICEKKAK